MVKRHLNESCSSDSTTNTSNLKKNYPPNFDLYLKALQIFNEIFRHDKQTTWPKFGQIQKQHSHDHSKKSIKNDQQQQQNVTTTTNETTSDDGHVTVTSDHVTQYNYWEYLDNYLKYVAKTGRTVFEWKLIKNYFFHKLDYVLQEMVDSEATPVSGTPQGAQDPPPAQPTNRSATGAVHFRILREFGQLHGCPFTIQRLAELLVEPRKHYKRAEKFFRAVEKNLLIVTMVTPEGERETFPPACLSGSFTDHASKNSAHAAENYPRDAFSALLLPPDLNEIEGGMEFSASAAKRPRFSPPHSTTVDNVEIEKMTSSSTNDHHHDNDFIMSSSDDVILSNNDVMISSAGDDDVIDGERQNRGGNNSAATSTADYVDLVETTTYAL